MTAFKVGTRHQVLSEDDSVLLLMVVKMVLVIPYTGLVLDLHCCSTSVLPDLVFCLSLY